MTATSAADWLSAPPSERRPAGPSPRALDARGLASMHHILVQLSEVALRPRFAETCKAFGDVVWCDDVDDLVSRVPAREALAVIVDAFDRTAHSTAGAVARIRVRRPDLPVILWCDRDQVADLGPFARAGVSAIVFRDESELERRLLSAVTRASDVAFQQLTDQALYRRVPTPYIPVVRFCLDHAASHPRTEQVARAVGLGPKALATQLRRAGLPTVGALVTWSKALVAAYRLEKTTEPVAVIARSLGFSSGSALRRLLKRSTNELPQAIREPGGFGWALRCFERYLVKAQARR
ncbi:MAG: helix-turn-helix domain-containing protein [Gemmatimonadales bacterium]|nr:helix-turn-helix domain-containing protein [Gemmatimonadales bacterium]